MLAAIFSHIAVALAAVIIPMIALWLLSVAIKDVSIVDIYWGLGFVVAAWTYFFRVEGYQPRQILVVALVTIWGVRLAGYLLYRNWGEEEDYRYQQMREGTDGFWWKSFFRVFLLQGILIAIVSLPLLAAQMPETPARLTIIDYLAIGVWAIGFFFEAVGDYQMARFKASPESKGKVLNEGLWRYTRHPNYFGDFVQWWAYGLLAVATMTVFGFVSLIGPAIMSFLLLKVSGVAMLEKDITERRPKYREYIERTNAFFPGPPKEQT